MLILKVVYWSSHHLNWETEWIRNDGWNQGEGWRRSSTREDEFTNCILQNCQPSHMTWGSIFFCSDVQELERLKRGGVWKSEFPVFECVSFWNPIRRLSSIVFLPVLVLKGFDLLTNTITNTVPSFVHNLRTNNTSEDLYTTDHKEKNGKPQICKLNSSPRMWLLFLLHLLPSSFPFFSLLSFQTQTQRVYLFAPEILLSMPFPCDL